MTYNKEEKLKSRKLIEYLFSKGKSMQAFPVKILYCFTPDASAPLQTGVTTSSRNFKKAIDRNRVKRVLREAYRLQKLPLQNTLVSKNKRLIIFIIYTGSTLPVFAEVFEKTGALLARLCDAVAD